MSLNTFSLAALPGLTTADDEWELSFALSGIHCCSCIAHINGLFEDMTREKGSLLKSATASRGPDKLIVRCSVKAPLLAVLDLVVHTTHDSAGKGIALWDPRLDTFTLLFDGTRGVTLSDRCDFFKGRNVFRAWNHFRPKPAVLGKEGSEADQVSFKGRVFSVDPGSCEGASVPLSVLQQIEDIDERFYALQFAMSEIHCSSCIAMINGIFEDAITNETAVAAAQATRTPSPPLLTIIVRGFSQLEDAHNETVKLVDRAGKGIALLHGALIPVGGGPGIQLRATLTNQTPLKDYRKRLADISPGCQVAVVPSACDIVETTKFTIPECPIELDGVSQKLVVDARLILACATDLERPPLVAGIFALSGIGCCSCIATLNDKFADIDHSVSPIKFAKAGRKPFDHIVAVCEDPDHFVEMHDAIVNVVVGLQKGVALLHFNIVDMSQHLIVASVPSEGQQTTSSLRAAFGDDLAEMRRFCAASNQRLGSGGNKESQLGAQQRPKLSTTAPSTPTKVDVPAASGNTEFVIKGMSCASCAAKIERALEKLAGVEKASVNFATASAVVAFDSDNVTESELVVVVSKLGYDCKVLRRDENPSASNERQLEALKRTDEIVILRRQLIVALCCTLPIAVLMVLMMANPSSLGRLNNQVIKDLKWHTVVEAILATPVVLYCGLPFLKRALTALRALTFTMDVLVAVGVGGAYLFSLIVAVARATTTCHITCYFDTAAMLLTFMVLGKFLEAFAKRHTGDALIKLLNLAPQTALLVGDAGDRSVPTSSLRPGDRVRVLANTSAPSDGTITEGETAMDESMVTGESLPQDKAPGDAVIGGTINTGNSVVVTITRVGEETTLAQILRIVRQAQMAKPSVQRVADRVAGVFVPFVLTVAALTFVVWLVLGLTDAYPGDWRKGDSPAVFAFSFFLATVVVACPCALGLATPTAVMVGTGIGAQLGILIKGGDALESARKTNCVLFDKTGTLTKGKMSVVHFEIFQDPSFPTDQALKGAVAGAEAESVHPIAKAVVDHLSAETRGPKEHDIRKLVQQTGKGLEVEFTAKSRSNNDDDVRSVYSMFIGAPKQTIIKDHAITTKIREFQSQGKIVVVAMISGQVAALCVLADELKDDTVAAIRALSASGCKVAMVTGDNRQTAKAVAEAIGIHEDDVFAEQLPGDKAEIVGRLQKEGYLVSFVGDGVNDSGALARADIGVALGAGTEVAIDAADVVLVNNGLTDLVTFFELARVTIKRIFINFVWAFMYNIVAIPIASGVFFAWWQYRLPPVLAGIAMVCSSLFVLASSLALKCFKPSRLGANGMGKRKVARRSPETQHLLVN